MAAICLATLKDRRSDCCFVRLCEGVNNKAVELVVDEPRLPRKRRVPLRNEVSGVHKNEEQTVEDLYRNYHLEIVAKLISEIERRFQSPMFTLYTKIVDILRCAVLGEYIPPTNLKDILEHFGDDLQESELGRY